MKISVKTRRILPFTCCPLGTVARLSNLLSAPMERVNSIATSSGALVASFDMDSLPFIAYYGPKTPKMHYLWYVIYSYLASFRVRRVGVSIVFARPDRGRNAAVAIQSIQKTIGTLTCLFCVCIDVIPPAAISPTPSRSLGTRRDTPWTIDPWRAHYCGWNIESEWKISIFREDICILWSVYFVLDDVDEMCDRPPSARKAFQRHAEPKGRGLERRA